MKHLIIATTPLQAKIAQHIKGLYPDQDFVSLYVSPVKNARQEHYAKDFDHVHYPQTAEDLSQICQELAGDYDTIFYASFDNSLILDLVASSTYQHLMSFDDGYADIYPLGMYAWPLQPSQVGSLGLTRDDLIERTEKHYTLYRSDYHVVAREKLVYLEHFFDLLQAPVSNGKTVKVLLGQKFSEEDDQISIRFISTYAKALAIDLYLPHPKETFTIPDVTYLETDLIFEDVLAQLFQEYEFVQVYHFTSSVSLHLKDHPYVAITGISLPYYEDRQKELRRLGCQFERVSLGW